MIEEIESAGNTPAYRGIAYIVFEDMDLTNFGNRIPQLNFEIIRSLSAGNPDALENRLGGMALGSSRRTCLRTGWTSRLRIARRAAPAAAPASSLPSPRLSLL